MSVAVPAAPTAAARVRIDDAGLHVPAEAHGPLLVELNGQYLFSCTPARDGRLEAGGLLVPWPEVLRPYLDGVGRLVVTDSAGVRYADQQVALGTGVGELAIRDASGHPLSVDKVGHLTRSFAATDAQIREEILGGTARALDDLRSVGVEAYLNYGMLLGAIRDGAMIAHDSDSDICYVSRAASPADLIRESYRIERRMRALGWRLLRMSGGDIKLLLPLSDGRQCHIDVFVAFWVGGTFYQLGNRSGDLPVSAVLPLSTIDLHGYAFPAPADPEAMLRFLYGENWRIPDPSFKYADPLPGVRRLNGWLRGFRTYMGKWSEFYQSPRVHQVPAEGSEFASWVQPFLADGDPVADLGSGTGRDAIALAAAGHPVRAYDYSRFSRRHIQREVRRAKADVEVRPLILGELRTVLANGADLARAPHHLYARQLLGCLEPAERANLWLLARMSLRWGGALLLEFSAEAPNAPLPGPAPLVHRLEVASVRAEIEASGGVIERLEVAPGVDSLAQSDPAICRLVARWPAPGTRSTAERNQPAGAEHRPAAAGGEESE
ncbi:class I SAM-dependent methyltransferase [Nocardioides sp. Bht2]|uniref:class I SAM-dependent methyltransferase n=1 Tax=Nocardioides sp. Bht2 TaxID=3392297 RepID=UPI0039B6ABF4